MSSSSRQARRRSRNPSTDGGKNRDHARDSRAAALGQRAPCAVELPICKVHDAEVIGEPVLGGLHHVYHLAA
jgi:hypothetical protein